MGTKALRGFSGWHESDNYMALFLDRAESLRITNIQTAYYDSVLDQLYDSYYPVVEISAVTYPVTWSLPYFLISGAPQTIDDDATNAGALWLRGGLVTGTQGNGGSVVIQSASGKGNGDSGDINISVSSGGAGGASGSLYLSGGTNASTTSYPAVSISGGSGFNGGNAGKVNITGGFRNSGLGPGGDITITGGNGYNGGTGGAVSISGGYTQKSGSLGGAVSLVGGWSNVASGVGGDALLSGGIGHTNGTGGSVSITGGWANAGNGGSISIAAANGWSTGVRSGGGLTLSSGNAGSAGAGTAGILSIVSGNGGTTTSGGSITITTGNGGSASGGSGILNLQTGTVVSGTIGGVNIRPGTVWKFGVDNNGVRRIDTCVTSISTAGSPMTLATTLSGANLNNVGAGAKCFYTLVDSNIPGLNYAATVISTQGIRFTAPNNVVIFDSTTISTISSAYIESTEFGAYLRLTLISSGRWGVTEKRGTWTVV